MVTQGSIPASKCEIICAQETDPKIMVKIFNLKF
jgi:hypothetical protein